MTTTTKKFTRAQVAKDYATSDDCYVIHQNKVYNVTPFLSDHPGGDDIIMDYAGKDISAIMSDPMEHAHSELAYELLADYLVGEVVDEDRWTAAGVPAKRMDSGVIAGVTESTGTDKASLKLSKHEIEAEHSTDNSLLSVKDPNFLDLSKPLLLQVLKMKITKREYMTQVHIPRHVKGSAPIFGNFLEPLTLTPWWVIPTLWIPVSCWMLASGHYTGGLQWWEVGVWGLVGLFAWSFVEYSIHRFLFHIDAILPEHPIAFTLHFLLHGVHHFLPMDQLRLVLPPALLVILATPIWMAMHAVLPLGLARCIMGGIFIGYISYDCMHYYLHHGKALGDYMKEMKTYHLDHHYKVYDEGFGITSKFWDWAFGTELILNRKQA